MAVGFTNISNGGGGVKGLSALPGYVKMGQTFSTDGKTVQTGTMNLTNLVPENIRKGVNINGVIGTHEILKQLTRETITISPKTGNLSVGQSVHLFTLPAGTLYVEAHNQHLIECWFYDYYSKSMWSSPTTVFQVYHLLEMRFNNGQMLGQVSMQQGLGEGRRGDNSPQRGYCAVRNISFVLPKMNVYQLVDYYNSTSETKEETYSASVLGTPHPLNVSLSCQRYMNGAYSPNPSDHDKTIMYRTQATTLTIYKM